MPEIDLEPRGYRWLGEQPRRWRRAAKARKVRDGNLTDKGWFRILGVLSGIWFGSVVGIARAFEGGAPLWPIVFLSLTPLLTWLVVMAWDDTA